ncbi:PREDICTED: XK-related protein 4-like [Galeopterus variegatus]|uniref:XK-related protein n=1 Tax=Galeopterus variegatus TaxID=482537 RepID=A0ABM0RUR9_GALVR|nr:PREDICTED: XK-related protein 4-like [Galeopterus variegatus]
MRVPCPCVCAGQAKTKGARLGPDASAAHDPTSGVGRPGALGPAFPTAPPGPVAGETELRGTGQGERRVAFARVLHPTPQHLLAGSAAGSVTSTGPGTKRGPARRLQSPGFTAAASLVSLAWALASYQKALRDSRDDKKPISYMAVIIQFCWHFFTIAARVITFALFASVFQLYFGIFIVLHWCIMTFWIVHCETEFCITKWEEIVFDMVVGIIYIFSWFNVKEGRTRCRLFIYYFVILLENTALSALWYLYKAPQIADAFAIPALCVVFSSFLTGVVFMLMYYAFFHPNGPRFGQSPSCACEDPATAFTLPPEVATSTLRSISNNRSVVSDRDQKFAERDGCVPVFQVRPTAPSTPSSRPPRIEESVIKIDLFRNRYPAWERHVLDRSLRKAILAFECSPSPPKLQYKDDALIQERLEYETTL